MITVNVENVGTLTFPDGTKNEIIQAKVNELVGKKGPKDYSGPLGQFKRIDDIYQEEVSTGLKEMQTMGAKPTGRNILKGFIGALQFGFAPLTAIAKGAVGEPISGTLEKAGVPKSVANFVGTLGEDAVYFLPYGKMVKTAIQAQKSFAGAKTLEKTGKFTGEAKKPLEFPKEISEEVISKTIEPISGTQKVVLREDVIGDVIKAVKESVSKLWNPYKEKRITQETVDYIMSRKDEIPKVLEKYGLSPEEFAAQIKETMSTSGRQLGQMGKWAKEIKKAFDDPVMKKLAESLDQFTIPEASGVDKFFSGFKKVENIRRSLLVSQVATTMRNIISQGGRLGIGAFDEALQGSIKGLTSGEGLKETTKATLQGLGEGLDLISSLFNRLRPNQRELLKKVLDTTNAIDAKSKIFSTPVLDVELGTTVSKVANILNRTQEYFFRNIAFEAKLNQLLKQSGIKQGLKGLDPKQIPENMFAKAADYSLEMTFAAMSKSKEGAKIVRGMSHPILTALVNPFPRFLYANALPFLKDFSPIGFLSAVNPKVVAELAGGNPQRFAKAASRATIGTIMLNTAMDIRSNPEIGGEKWYEIKYGGKSWDTRAFAPLSTYLFIAESLQNPEKVKPSDFFSALLSLNRLGGTGLVISDIMRGKGSERTIDVATKIMGEWIGSWTTPIRTPKDIYSAIDPKEAIIRDTREQEFFGPTKRNIPLLSQTMPEAVTPLKTEPIKTETPILRQLTGLSNKTKNIITTEVDRIMLPSGKIYPKTGNPEADREVSKLMAPIVEKTAKNIVNLPTYKRMPVEGQRLILGEYFREIKKEARNQLMKTQPKLAMKIKLERLSDDEKALIEKFGSFRIRMIVKALTMR